MNAPQPARVGNDVSTGPGPASARRILDDLETQVGELPADDGSGLHGDFVEQVPGASEPPD